MIRVRFQRLSHAVGLPLPARHSEQAAGLDLMAAVAEDAPVSLAPGQRALIPTGFAMELPPDCEGQIRPRSGLAAKAGVTVLNAPGTIDADYRGEMKVLLINHGNEMFYVERGARIAQLVICYVQPVTASESEVLSGTSRGERGFGSTGWTSRADQGE